MENKAFQYAVDNAGRSLTSSLEWRALERHQQDIKSARIADLFRDDPKRFEKYALYRDGLILDLSKNLLTETTVDLLTALARRQNLEIWRDKMFAGEKINSSENRPVLHTALRQRTMNPVYVDGRDVMPNINRTLKKMRSISEAVQSGLWQGHSGQKIKNVVNIGIGGQHFGVYMVAHALAPYQRDDLQPHFVSNVDGSDISSILKKCDPETTLFLVSSKSFTTQETLANAQAAREWVLSYYQDKAAIPAHFIAMSTRPDHAAEFGIPADNVLSFPEGVGGRYSVWSCSGLILAICFGMDHFENMLNGAHVMDQHFKTAPLDENMPVMLALLGVWYRNFWNAEAIAMTAYDHNLRSFHDWLQQVDMESNGKYIDRDGKAVNYATGPVLFGQPGSSSQHVFMQHVHQGTQMIPVDFIAARQATHNMTAHHQKLLSNFLAQTEALMLGCENAENEHAVLHGNKPSNSIVIDKLDPYHLGMLMALYEHKVFVQGVIWNINSFDQYGVELGKTLADKLLTNLETGQSGTHDSSTSGLLKYILMD